MNGKTLGIIAVILIILGLGWWWYSSSQSTPEAAGPTPTGSTSAKTAVVPGSYLVDPTESQLTWAGTKPLIPNYVDSGTIGIKDGQITAGTNTASGSFTIDMTTLHVGNTTRAGQENALAEKLLGSEFFEVSKYPTATFVITSVTPTASTTSDFIYSVRGDLTMKGVKNEITFPAQIFMAGGDLHASAAFSIDRTKWNIKFNSANFFGNLGNNAIADDVALTFDLVAHPAEGSSQGTAIPTL